MQTNMLFSEPVSLECPAKKDPVNLKESMEELQEDLKTW